MRLLINLKHYHHYYFLLQINIHFWMKSSSFELFIGLYKIYQLWVNQIIKVHDPAHIFRSTGLFQIHTYGEQSWLPSKQKMCLKLYKKKLALEMYFRCFCTWVHISQVPLANFSVRWLRAEVNSEARMCDKREVPIHSDNMQTWGGRFNGLLESHAHSGYPSASGGARTQCLVECLYLVFWLGEELDLLFRSQ